MISLSLKDIRKLIEFYKTEHFYRKSLYVTHDIKPFINRPFPSDISENLVKCFIEKVEMRKCLWTPEKKHDLFLPLSNRKIEVKAFTSDNQQISFTRTQEFDLLYVLDCRKFEIDCYVVHVFCFSSADMSSMEIGIDSVEVDFFKQEKRNVSLKRLIQFASNKHCGYFKDDVKIEEKVCLLQVL